MPRFLPFAVLFFGGNALRTLQEDSGEPGSVVRPTGPAVKPVGRHIQALYVTNPHGLTDRMLKFIEPLIVLGHHFNATMHMPHGAHGPRQWLTGDHSVEIADSWGRYFDLRANGGNPFHETVNFQGCRELENPNATDMLTLFQGGELCVNILSMVDRLPFKMHLRQTLPLLVSKEITAAAERFRARYKLPQEPNAKSCPDRPSPARTTAPATSGAATTSASTRSARTLQWSRGHDWIFFLYAEAGYREALHAALKPLGLRYLFEDDAVINDVYPKDNYFTYLLGKYLHGGAETILETHLCKHPWPQVLHRREVSSHHGIFLPRWQEGAGQAGAQLGELFMEEKTGAVCDDRARAAKLIHPGGYHGGYESDVVRSHAR